MYKKEISSKSLAKIINMIHGFGAWHCDPSVTLVTTHVPSSQRRPSNPSTLLRAYLLPFWYQSTTYLDLLAPEYHRVYTPANKAKSKISHLKILNTTSMQVTSCAIHVLRCVVSWGSWQNQKEAKLCLMTAAVTSDAGYILVLGSTRRKLQRNGNLFCKYHWKMLSCPLPNFDSVTWTNWFPSADIYNVSIFGTFATRTALHMTSFSKYKSARFFVLLLFTTGPCWSCPQRSGWGHR